MCLLFDEIPSLPFQDIKVDQNVADGKTDERTDGWTVNVKTVYPPTNTVCRGGGGCYKNIPQTRMSSFGLRKQLPILRPG